MGKEIALKNSAFDHHPALQTPRVVIVQRVLPHYRLAFFDALHTALEAKGIKLEVLYGQHAPGTVPQTVSPQCPWAKFVFNYYVTAFGCSLTWQPVMDATREADLVIVEHAVRLLATYPLLVRRTARKQLLAYWGHGKNFQAHCCNSPVERFKRFLVNSVDWWFAYTDRSKTILHQRGFSENRISVVQNTINDAEFRTDIASISQDHLEREKKRLGIFGSQIVLYCGGMYPDKRLEFLLRACVRLRELVPGVEVLFIGSGPDQRLVEETCSRQSWMHFLGPVFGSRRALYFAMCQALLLPGAVGLAVMDSFVAETPLFTTSITFHGPEIDYLVPAVNGIMTEPKIEDYAKAVAYYLDNPGELELLRKGCRESATVYTLDNMVNNFANGVEACLAAEWR